MKRGAKLSERSASRGPVHREAGSGARRRVGGERRLCVEQRHVRVGQAARSLQRWPPGRPAIAEALAGLNFRAGQERAFEAVLADRFPALESVSVDYAVLEVAPNVVTLEAAFDWDDLGRWRAWAAASAARRARQRHLGPGRAGGLRPLRRGGRWSAGRPARTFRYGGGDDAARHAGVPGHGQRPGAARDRGGARTREPRMSETRGLRLTLVFGCLLAGPRLCAGTGRIGRRAGAARLGNTRERDHGAVATRRSRRRTRRLLRTTRRLRPTHSACSAPSPSRSPLRSKCRAPAGAVFAPAPRSAAYDTLRVDQGVSAVAPAAAYDTLRASTEDSADVPTPAPTQPLAGSTVVMPDTLAAPPVAAGASAAAVPVTTAASASRPRRPPRRRRTASAGGCKWPRRKTRRWRTRAVRRRSHC